MRLRKNQGGRLPLRTAEIMYVQLPPDHGAMPEAANWLYSLAAARDPRSLTVWQRVAGLLHPGEEDFKDTLQESTIILMRYAKEPNGWGQGMPSRCC